MAPWKLFSIEITTNYKAHIGSWTFLIFILYNIALIVIPFLILFGIGNIWPIDGDYEQPSILFTRMFSVTMAMSRSGSDVIKYTSNLTGGTFVPDNVRIPTVTNLEYDDNNDGLKDRLEFNLSMPITANESVHDIDLILIFNCTLKRYSTTYESFARLHSSGNLSRMTLLKAAGDMRLIQLELLKGSRSYFGLRQKSDNKPCSTLLTNSTFFEVISCYVDSRVYLELADVKYSWQPIRLEDGNFVMNAYLNYTTKQNLMYEPYHWTSAKWFYIQWIAMHLALYLTIQPFLSYLFINRLVDAFPHDPENNQVKEKLI